MKGELLKKFFLVVSVVFLLLVVAAVGGVVYLYLQWPADKVLALVNEALTKEYRLRIEVSSARIDWLKGVQLENPELVETGGKVLLEAKEISAYYDLGALIQRTLKFSRLSIRGLYATIEDIEGVVKRFQASSTQKKTSEGFGFVIQQMVFVDSQVVYNSIPLNVNVTWNLGSLTTAASYSGTLVSMYGKATFQGKGKTIRFQIEDMEVGRFFPAGKDFLVKRVGGEVYLQGNQWLVKGTSLSLLWQSNQITSSRYQVLYDTKKENFLLSDTIVRYNTSEVAISNLFYNPKQKLAYGVVENLVLRVGDVLQGGSGAVEGKVVFRYENGDLSQLDGRLTLKDIGYGPLQIEGAFDIAGLSLNGEATLRFGKNSFYLRSLPIGRQGMALSLTAERFDLSDALRQKWPSSTKNTKGSASPQEKVSISWADVIDVLPLDVEVNIPLVLYENLEIENFQLHLLPRGKALVLENISCQLLRGSVIGDAVVAGDFLRGSIRLSDIKLHDLNETMLRDGKTVYGTLKGTIEYQLPLTNLLMGYMGFAFNVDKPEFRGLVLQNQISEVLYNLPLERLSFDTFVVTGEMREGTVSFKDVRLDSYDIQVSAPTLVFLAKKTVDSSITLSVSKDYVVGLPNVAQLLAAGYSEGNRLVFRLRVTNTIEKPKVVLLPAGR